MATWQLVEKTPWPCKEYATSSYQPQTLSNETMCWKKNKMHNKLFWTLWELFLSLRYIHGVWNFFTAPDSIWQNYVLKKESSLQVCYGHFVNSFIIIFFWYFVNSFIILNNYFQRFPKSWFILSDKPNFLHSLSVETQQLISKCFLTRYGGFS